MMNIFLHFHDRQHHRPRLWGGKPRTSPNNLETPLISSIIAPFPHILVATNIFDMSKPVGNIYNYNYNIVKKLAITRGYDC